MCSYRAAWDRSFAAPAGAAENDPGLHLTLSLDDRIADLVTEGVDVALRLSSEPPQGHAARVLARIETALFAAPGFKELHCVSELAAHPHVRFSGIAQDAPLRLVSGDKTVDVKVNTVFRANTSEALLQALESGIGIGGMQLPLAANALQSAGLVPVLPAAITRSLPLCGLP